MQTDGSTRNHAPPALRALIVDDDDDHLHLAARLLGKHCQVGTAGSGRTALRLLRSATWDVLVLDYHLSDLSAAEVLGYVASSGLRLPTVVLTANPSEAEARTALLSGAQHYLVKSPETYEELPQLVLRLVAKNRLALGPPLPVYGELPPHAGAEGPPHRVAAEETSAPPASLEQGAPAPSLTASARPPNIS